MRLKFYKAYPEDHWTIFQRIAHNGMALFALLYQWLPTLFHYLLCKRNKEYAYETAICMIFKNESQLLHEWIEYHLLIGIEHFYLYNNNSTDNYLEIIQPYIDKGIVTLIDWPYDHGQLGAYKDCYDRYAGQTHWLAYIDADEFINLQNDNSINDMLRRFRYQPSLHMSWRDFGTSGNIASSNNSLVTETFVAAWPWLCNVGKTIINNDFHFKKISVHYCIAKYMGMSLYPVNDCKLPCPYYPTIWSMGIGKQVYLNHYFSRSYEWYLYKDMKRGSALSSKNAETRRNPARFRLHELNNFCHDYSIQRWLVMLKIKMGRN